jgi:hypothetical protein
VRIDETALYLGWRVLISRLPADKTSLSAPKAPAASARCSAVKDLRIPNQEKDSRMAAMVDRKRSDERGLISDRLGGSSNRVLIGQRLLWVRVEYL